MDKEKRKEYCKKHYEEHKIDKCKNTIDKYCDKSINRVYCFNQKRVKEMYDIYPYEEYGEKCFKRLVHRFELRKDSEIYQECYDVAMKAYIYTICRCSLKNDCDELIRAYIYKVMRIYIICVFNIYYGERRKIQEIAKDYIEKNY